MKSPTISRPTLPKGYADNPASFVNWEWVVEQMTVSENYWLSSVRPDGRPHVVPRWGAFIDNKLYYDGSPETRHSKNIVKNPNVSLHLESGYKVIIMEGFSVSAERPIPEFAKQLAEAITKKYASQGYSPEPTQWDEGGLYVFTRVNAWLGRRSTKTQPNLYLKNDAEVGGDSVVGSNADNILFQVKKNPVQK